MILLYSNEWLIRGLVEGKQNCIDFIYREYFPMVRSIVDTGNGNYEDAEDVFHDGLIVVYNRLINKGLSLNSSLKTYLFSVCKHIWMRRCERKYRLLYGADSYVNEIEGDYAAEAEEEERAEKLRLFNKHFMQMPEFCQTILIHYLTKTPLADIALTMNYKDVGYVKARKYYCKNLLRKKILSDPECRQFMNYE